MSCQKIQRRLFALPDPDRVPAVVRNHLAECSACREIHRRIAQVEHHAPLLVVPASPYAKAALLRKIQSGPTVRDRIIRYADRIPETFRHPGRRQLAGASLAAAALLLIVLGIRMVPGTNDTPPVAQIENKQPAPDTLLASVVERQLTLAEVSKPRPQTEALANLADDLHGAARSLARASEPGDSLRDLSDWYGQVVKTEESRAAKLSAAERQAVLPSLIQRLDQASALADAAAQEIEANQVEPLRKMAAAARTAKEHLEALGRQDARLWPKIEFPGSAAGFTVAFGQATLKECRRAPLTVGVAAAVEAPVRSANDEVRRFQRNRDLIKAVVEGSLRLAEEEDPVRRASVCGDVARSMVEAIQKAAEAHEGPRAAELGDHLRVQMKRGIAGNLKAAAGVAAPPGSTRDRDMKQVAENVDLALQPLEEQLKKTPEPEYVQHTLQAVHDGRAEIDRVVKIKE